MRTQLEAAAKKAEQMRKSELRWAWTILIFAMYSSVCVVQSIIEHVEVAPWILGAIAVLFFVMSFFSFRSAYDIEENPEHTIYMILTEYTDEVEQ